MVLKLDVTIHSGTDIQGVQPFVVVCLDKNLNDELYKSSAVQGGANVTWDETFTIDLTSAMKNAIADGHPEPSYLTFNLFDNGAPSMPALGSAGVLLSNVQEKGYAEGEFPVINGTGTLGITVGNAPKQGWIHSKQAKTAGIVGAVGMGALAVGLTARHFHNKKKKNEEDNAGAAGSAMR